MQLDEAADCKSPEQHEDSLAAREEEESTDVCVYMWLKSLL